MDRRTAIDALAPVHAHALRMLDHGFERSIVAARMGLEVDELNTLVRVAEAKVNRLLSQHQNEEF